MNEAVFKYLILYNYYFQICACPPEMILSANNRTCMCPTHNIKCIEHDVCIKKEQWYINFYIIHKYDSTNYSKIYTFFVLLNR